MPILDDRDVETEGLIREYQRNAKPTQSTIRLLEFYGGEDWRKNEGARRKRYVLFFNTFIFSKIFIK